ncbi:MAG TPA: lipopolysaccharide biosynthesis protein [Candidatus Omnitrophota bacterium]|nr:lipopolysaccharide biosynthesis protein [Candidatus Omnitrophota bacterium]
MTAKGIGWQLGTNFAQKIVQFITTIIIARRLGPANYGLFALTLTIVSTFELFKSLGIDAALMKRKDDINEAANTAFVIIPFLGIFLYCILLLTASLIGQYVGNKDFIPVVKVLGLVFVFSGLARVPAVLLERNLEYKKISIAEFISSFFFSACAIALTFLDFEIWSLVYAYVGKVFIYSFLIISSSKWKLTFKFKKRVALDMLNFGKYIFLTSTAWFVKKNLDNVLVGKYLGVEKLGFYSIAFNISNFSTDYFGNKIFRVVFPSYSRLQDDVEGLKRAFLKTFKITALIAIPFGVCVFFLGGDFVKVAYGNRWIGVTTVLTFLAFSGVFNSLNSIFSALFMAVNKPKFGFWMMAIELVVFVLFIVPAAMLFNLNGVGFIVSFSSLLSFLLGLFVCKVRLGIRLGSIFNSLKSSFLISIVLICLILIIKKFLSAFLRYHVFISLPLLSSIVVIFYFICGVLTEKQLFKEIVGLIRRHKT